MELTDFKALVLVNFGGPRNLMEIGPFLAELLGDQEVIRTSLPPWIHKLLFNKIAQKRSKEMLQAYKIIGGKSPIYEDTEAIARKLQAQLPLRVITYHRYLPATHKQFKEEILAIPPGDILVFPLFPQFTYACSGSVANWFRKYLPVEVSKRLFWIKSYANHFAFTQLFADNIIHFLQEKKLNLRDTLLLFSSHGLPQKFVDSGDIYEKECRLAFSLITQKLPQEIPSLLSYQSKFGPGLWLKPYTEEVCKNFRELYPYIKQVAFIPLSFTSDHIETLFEVEHEYMPVLTKQGIETYRLPAFNQQPEWIETIKTILYDFTLSTNEMLIRKP